VRTIKIPRSLGFIVRGRVARIILGGFLKKSKEFAEIVGRGAWPVERRCAQGLGGNGRRR
jgi:hypothetical protein